ncbi:hypothetical protein ACFW5D_11390 [Streptomyces sp. NPDC058770]|uniref:hypothetical protein n=1 Tax=Streptomyces sp. NPDC058770 TaxID=3346631 RepID=UPI0036814D6C
MANIGEYSFPSQEVDVKLIGFYREMDPEYESSWGGPIPPPESGAGKYPVRDVVNYLKSGYLIFDVMEMTTDVIQEAFRVPGGSSLLTDGHFVWREDLAPHVERYVIDLPQEFLDAARSHGFRTPPSDHEVLLEISIEASRTLGFRPA